MEILLLLLGAGAIYLIAKNSSLSEAPVAGPPPPANRTDFNPYGLGFTPLDVGWKQTDVYTDQNKVVWNIFHQETVVGGYGARATGGSYVGQTFTAVNFTILKTMIDAYAASIAAGKGIQAAIDSAVAAAEAGIPPLNGAGA